MTGKQIKKKDKSTFGAQAPSAIVEIFGSFTLIFPTFFVASQIGTNSIVKVTAGNGKKQNSFFLKTQSYSYRSEKMICHLGVSSHPFNCCLHHFVYLIFFFHQDSPANGPQSYCAPVIWDPFKCRHTFNLRLWVVLTTESLNWTERNEIWNAVFISPEQIPNGDWLWESIIPTRTVNKNTKTTCLVCRFHKAEHCCVSPF